MTRYLPLLLEGVVDVTETVELHTLAGARGIATTAGTGVKGFDGFLAYADQMAPLGNATAADCAEYTLAMFSDLTQKVTLQNLIHDGGFSNMGVSEAVMEKFD